MDHVTKEVLKKAVSNRLNSLAPNEGITTRDLILTTPEAVNILSLRKYDIHGKDSADYMRRLVHEIRKLNGQYGLGHIRAVYAAHAVYIKGRKKPLSKKEWMWVNISNSETLKEITIQKYIIQAGKLIKTADEVAKVLKVENKPLLTGLDTAVNQYQQDMPKEKRLLITAVQDDGSSSTSTEEESEMPSAESDTSTDNVEEKEDTTEDKET